MDRSFVRVAVLLGLCAAAGLGVRAWLRRETPAASAPRARAEMETSTPHESATAAPTPAPATPPPRAEPAPRPAREEPSESAKDPVASAFSLLRTGLEAVDAVGREVFPLPVEDELRMGGEIAREIRASTEDWSDASALARVERLARPILERRERTAIEYRFRLVDDQSVNAFALLGGNVFVHRGLCERFEDDAALQFVIAHEVAHVDRGHCCRGFNYARHAEQVLGDAELAALVATAARLVQAGYSKELEFEADSQAYDWLRTCGRSHDESLRGMRRLLALEATPSPAPAEPEEAQDPLLGALDEHFRSHPPTRDRLRRLEARARD